MSIYRLMTTAAREQSVEHDPYPLTKRQKLTTVGAGLIGEVVALGLIEADEAPVGIVIAVGSIMLATQLIRKGWSPNDVGPTMRPDLAEIYAVHAEAITELQAKPDII